jgi:hypothetical protein
MPLALVANVTSLALQFPEWTRPKFIATPITRAPDAGGMSAAHAYGVSEPDRSSSSTAMSLSLNAPVVFRTSVTFAYVVPPDDVAPVPTAAGSIAAPLSGSSTQCRAVSTARGAISVPVQSPPSR